MRGAILAQFGAILRNSAQFSDAPPHLPGVFIGFLTDELLFNAVGKLILSVAPPGIAAPKPAAAADGAAAKGDEKNGKNGSKAGSKAKKPPGAKKPESKPPGSAEYDELMGAYGEMKKVVLGVYNTRWSLIGRVVIWLWAARQMQPRAKEFYDYSQQFAEALSQPQIMYKARLQTGQEIIVDDYREAYFWLRDHTPADARVMAWWDYGYQIAGIANRTTIADGNTCVIIPKEPTPTPAPP